MHVTCYVRIYLDHCAEHVTCVAIVNLHVTCIYIYICNHCVCSFRCIAEHLHCDGENDCDGGEDEVDCGEHKIISC